MYIGGGSVKVSTTRPHDRVVLTNITRKQPIAAYHAANGCRDDMNGRVLRSMPCAFSPRWKRMYVTDMPNQLDKPETADLRAM